MSASDCDEGSRLLEVAARAIAPPGARAALIKHIENCPVCKVCSLDRKSPSVHL
jgi:hypothetical protein